MIEVESAKPDEVRTLLRDVIASTNQVLASHKVGLQRLNKLSVAELHVPLTIVDALKLPISI